MNPLDMIPIQYRMVAMIIAAVVALAAAAMGGWTARGWLADAEISKIMENIANDREHAVKQALETERALQEKANEALRKQNLEISAAHAWLLDQYKRLQSRPSRPANGVSSTTKTECKGATGAELSREDGEFLAGEAARADEIRAGLIACYEVR